jgi:hypothetical protein
MTLKSYENAVVVFKVEDNLYQNYSDNYKDILDPAKILKPPFDEGLDDFVLGQYKKSFHDVFFHYVTGVTFSNITNGITGWYNGDFYHSKPLTLNLLNRAILKSAAGEDYDIIVTNKPYIYKKAKQDSTLDIFHQIKSIIFIFTVAFSIWISGFIKLPIEENVSKAKMSQMIAGMNRFIYWLVPYLMDLLEFIIFILVVMLFMLSFNRDTFGGVDSFFVIWGIGILYGAAVIPLIYSLSQAFKKPSSGAIAIVVLGIAGIFFNL